MTKKSRSDYKKHKNVETEMMLGKRHDYSKSEEMNFKSLAISLGFSANELKVLDRIYVGPAKPDSEDEIANE